MTRRVRWAHVGVASRITGYVMLAHAGGWRLALGVGLVDLARGVDEALRTDRHRATDDESPYARESRL